MPFVLVAIFSCSSQAENIKELSQKLGNTHAAQSFSIEAAGSKK